MHVIVLGQSGSGKSYLCKQLVKQYKKRGIGTLVLDPMEYPDWGADLVTANRDQFIRIAKKNVNCALFIDEATEMVGLHPPPDVMWLATRARHQGHLSHFLTHRYTGLNITVRGQCSHMYLFNVARKDAGEMAIEWNDDALLNAAELKTGWYYEKHRMQPAILRKPIKG